MKQITKTEIAYMKTSDFAKSTPADYVVHGVVIGKFSEASSDKVDGKLTQLPLSRFKYTSSADLLEMMQNGKHKKLIIKLPKGESVVFTKA